LFLSKGLLWLLQGNEEICASVVRSLLIRLRPTPLQMKREGTMLLLHRREEGLTKKLLSGPLVVGLVGDAVCESLHLG
jgi:hypothetical protein